MKILGLEIKGVSVGEQARQVGGDDFAVLWGDADLATAGYGIATGNAAIFKGASLLFLTNMLAIAFSVAFIALWYGLGRLHAPKELLWKTVLACVILTLLSLPLARTLKDSVRETWRAKQVEEIMRRATAPAEAMLDRLEIRTDEDNVTRVHTVVLTTSYEPELETALKDALRQRLKGTVRLRLDQIETAGARQTARETTLSPGRRRFDAEGPPACQGARLAAGAAARR